jgi:hypothetical protein
MRAVKVFSVILVDFLQEIFRCMDTDGSGTVSLKELIEFLRAVSGDVDAREVMYPPTNQTSSLLSHLRALSGDVDAREVMYPPTNQISSFLSHLRALSGDVDAKKVMCPSTPTLLLFFLTWRHERRCRRHGGNVPFNQSDFFFSFSPARP